MKGQQSWLPLHRDSPWFSFSLFWQICQMIVHMLSAGATSTGYPLVYAARCNQNGQRRMCRPTERARKQTYKMEIHRARSRRIGAATCWEAWKLGQAMHSQARREVSGRLLRMRCNSGAIPHTFEYTCKNISKKAAKTNSYWLGMGKFAKLVQPSLLAVSGDASGPIRVGFRARIFSVVCMIHE